ncbi:hypothetical protein IMCC3088_552 [Aequoribacter fuscus]|uniref:Uncharacterized protein n=1 Tax=Aequoribacter fuscus TaxID=2518989 RepID=F3KZV9_9GAMM|nr:hypothetical protein IMCC3088_552 [Aequoribacter fuscus]
MDSAWISFDELLGRFNCADFLEDMSLKKPPIFYSQFNYKIA